MESKNDINPVSVLQMISQAPTLKFSVAKDYLLKYAYDIQKNIDKCKAKINKNIEDMEQ